MSKVAARIRNRFESARPENHRVKPMNEFLEFPVAETEQSIADRFEKVVAAAPEEIAICGETEVLTYAKLNQCANRVARAILSRQEISEKPVAFLVRKPEFQIAAILGILKSGNMYVPLDRSFPDSRLARIVEDTESPLIVTSEAEHSRAAMG